MLLETQTSADAADFTFKLADFPAAELQVTALDGEEGLGRLFEFRVKRQGRYGEDRRRAGHALRAWNRSALRAHGPKRFAIPPPGTRGS